MKKILFLALTIISIQASFAQSEVTYGKGLFVWSAFDLIEKKIAGDGKGEVVGDITKLVKYIENGKPVAYQIYVTNRKDLKKSVFKLIKDPTGEYGAEFINPEDNHVYLVNDILDTDQYLELLSTKELPGVSNKYRMFIQVFLK